MFWCLLLALSRATDENLFYQVITNKKHVRHGLLPLPSVASQNYDLRNRKHNLELTSKTSQLKNCNIIPRMLYLNTY